MHLLMQALVKTLRAAQGGLLLRAIDQATEARLGAGQARPAFASTRVGFIIHRMGVLLLEQAGIEVVHVPHKGSLESMTALLGSRSM